MYKVGIIIINYNSASCLAIAMESLMNVSTRVPFSVGIIDNGSVDEEKNACKKLVQDMQSKYPQQELKLFDAGKNLGFSGGNNVVIKYFLEREDITHICLLNSDVIVTDFWLEYLLEKDKDIIGPVTNAAGNEQTIQIDYDANIDSSAITKVNEYAAKRHVYYKDYVVESELVTFFATIFKREVIEKVGFLDEQFYPGSYEDDDYCVRVQNAGYHIYIARDCFVHHFGSGSFSKLNMEERRNISDINRERFERKWGCKWKDRTWKLLESCKQDMDYLIKQENFVWPRQQLDASLSEIEKLMADWGEVILFFTSQAANNKPSIYSYSVKQLLQVIVTKLERWLSLKKQTLSNKVNTKIHYYKNKKEEQNGISKIYSLIHQARKKKHQAICVFAPMYNKENEKDGYIQRIKAIDNTVLKQMCRIYLYDEGIDCVKMRFSFIDDLHGYIVFNSHNYKHLNEIIRLVKECGVTYTHSILRFIEDRTSKQLWQIFEQDNVKHFWDMHGAVPEEYELSGSELGSQLANNIELFMANRVDCIVVVTEAMGKHIKQKYPSMKAEIIVVPILNRELLNPVACEKQDLKRGISIVYAGGTQPWQNIPLMQNIISDTYQLYHYKMFVPVPEEFMSLWKDYHEDMDIVVESMSPEDLYKEYETCDFGFVLRDASPVNYVACPTKIIEYLRFGIIPVLKTTEIGDFVEMGMQYITCEDIMNGIKITNEDRKNMIDVNYKVLSGLLQVYLEGLERLTKMVEAKNENY